MALEVCCTKAAEAPCPPLFELSDAIRLSILGSDRQEWQKSCHALKMALCYTWLCLVLCAAFRVQVKVASPVVCFPLIYLPVSTACKR